MSTSKYGFVCVVVGTSMPIGEAIVTELAGKYHPISQSSELLNISPSSPRRSSNLRLQPQRRRLIPPHHHPIKNPPKHKTNLLPPNILRRAINPHPHRRRPQRLGPLRCLGLQLRTPRPALHLHDHALGSAEMLRGEQSGAVLCSQVFPAGYAQVDK